MSSYVANFSAIALLKPKTVGADELFSPNNMGDLKKLRSLYPDTKDVKAAIEAFKKEGIKAEMEFGYGIRISGSTEALYRLCKLRIRLLPPQTQDASPAFSFFDDDENDKGAEITPQGNDSLSKWAGAKDIQLVTIYLSTAGEFQVYNPPRAPGTDVPWAKTQPYHVWPHELRYRLGAKDSADLQNAMYFNDATKWPMPELKPEQQADLGFGVGVSLVDSGVYFDHPYFINDLGVGNSAVARLRMERRELAEHTRKVETFKRNLDTLVGALGLLDIALWSKARVDLPPTTAFLKMQASSVVNNPLFEIVFSGFVSEGPGNPQGRASLNRDSRGALTMIQSEKNPTHTYRRSTFRLLISWIEAYLKPLVYRYLEVYQTAGSGPQDLNGHGTGMVGSLLGVARRADIFMYFGAHFKLGIQSAIVGNMDELERSFDRAVRDAQVKNNWNGKDFRIISNSWSHSIRLDRWNEHRVVSDWKRWYGKVQEATNSGTIILFCAGNAGRPSFDEFALQAIMGPAGAIVVGGAWDMNEKAPAGSRQPKVTLSTAAHGFKLDLDPRRPVQIPDVCALVGPQGPNDSRYVYMPTIPQLDWWAYDGGGTSSATAQVAGVCACIRAKFPTLAPIQIKDALILGGLKVTDGKSYQGKSPQEIALDPVNRALTRVNIAGALTLAESYFNKTAGI